jgi:hypothetical protein
MYVVHAATGKDASAFDREVDLVEFPEACNILISSCEIYEAAGPEAVEALRKHPVAFAAVALAEVLGRLQWRGVPCSDSRIPTRPEAEVAAGLSRRYVCTSV